MAIRHEHHDIQCIPEDELSIAARANGLADVLIGVGSVAIDDAGDTLCVEWRACAGTGTVRWDGAVRDSTSWGLVTSRRRLHAAQQHVFLHEGHLHASLSLSFGGFSP